VNRWNNAPNPRPWQTAFAGWRIADPMRQIKEISAAWIDPAQSAQFVGYAANGRIAERANW
jgi:hypothetical protein